MKPIPQNILAGFNDLLKQRKVPPMLLADYRKWLRYFLDFRAKYPLPDTPSDKIRLFADKLRSKNQTAGQVEQATDAISLFFAFQREVKSNLRWSPGALPRRRCPGGNLRAKAMRTEIQLPRKQLPRWFASRRAAFSLRLR